MDNQQYCLKWNNFSQHLKYAFNTIWSSDDSFTDVTLAIQGGFKMRGHKMVLSACSYYFKKLLVADTSEAPVLILHDVSRPELEALLHFMYHGEVNVTQEVIPGLLKAAEMLQIRGLCAAPPPPTTAAGKSTSTPTSTAGRAVKRLAPAATAADPPPPSPASKKARKKPPSAPPPLSAAPPAEGRGRSSVESEESRDTNGVGGGSDTEGDGQLRIDEESNGGLEPETLLDEQQDAEADGWSQGSGATEDQLLYPLPRPEQDADAAPSPEAFTFSSQLRNLAVKVKLEPRMPNDLEAAIVSSMPKSAMKRRRRGPLPGFVPLVVPRPPTHADRTAAAAAAATVRVPMRPGPHRHRSPRARPGRAVRVCRPVASRPSPLAGAGVPRVIIRLGGQRPSVAPAPGATPGAGGPAPDAAPGATPAPMPPPPLLPPPLLPPPLLPPHSGPQQFWTPSPAAVAPPSKPNTKCTHIRRTDTKYKYSLMPRP